MVGSLFATLTDVDPANLCGSVAIARIRELVKERALATGERRFTVLFDDELSPPQHRALERALQISSFSELMPRHRRPNKKKLAMERQSAAARAAAGRDEEYEEYEEDFEDLERDSEDEESSSPNFEDDYEDLEDESYVDDDERDSCQSRPQDEVAFVSVVDRTALVLDLFARRASSPAQRHDRSFARILVGGLGHSRVGGDCCASGFIRSRVFYGTKPRGDRASCRFLKDRALPKSQSRLERACAAGPPARASSKSRWLRPTSNDRPLICEFSLAFEFGRDGCVRGFGRPRVLWHKPLVALESAFEVSDTSESVP